MEPNRLRFLISALFVLSLAGYNFLTYTSTTSEQSTFNLEPGLTANLVTTRTSSDVISGQFQENSGSPVSFYILSSAQFAAFQAQTSFNYLYGIVNVVSGSFSYTFPLQDTYEIVFRHGTGLINSYETVTFQRSYQTHNSSHLQLGLVFLVFGAASLVVAFRPEKPKKVETLPGGESPTPTPLVGGPTPSSFLKACPKCGTENPLAAEKCRACDAKI
ncbi:hypothetical protein E6H35_02465 [Candidatus Bathyarchaeota archaeon]|nr:MAG: hypothetical protein E6H35_02465 [Candidatus Bathyarchaeota archaeon]